MKQLLILPAVLLCFASPLAAQEGEGFNLMEEGARIFLRGLMSEMEPAIEDLEGFAEEIGPVMRGLAGELRPIVSDILAAIDDIQYYREIEVLENGDILIRRSENAPPFGEDEPDIELPGSGVIDAPQIDL